MASQSRVFENCCVQHCSVETGWLACGSGESAIEKEAGSFGTQSFVGGQGGNMKLQVTRSSELTPVSTVPQVFLLCLAGVHSHSLVRRSPDKLAIAPVDSYLPAAEDDSLSGYEEGSGEGGGEQRSQQPGDEASGEEGEEDGQFDLPEYSDEENLVKEATEPSLEDNLVEEEGSAEDLEKAGAIYEAPGPEIPEGDPANLPDSPPGSKVEYCSPRWS